MPNQTLPDFEHVVERWKDDAKKYPYEIDLANSFVAYGFQLIDVEPVTTDQLNECLRHRQRPPYGRYIFLKNDHHSPYLPSVFKTNSYGLEVHVNTADFDHRAIWRFSECLSGTEVISYWEDTKLIKDYVAKNGPDTWVRGQHIWIDQQIGYANSFLATVNYIADYFQFTGEVKIRVFFSGLSGRTLNFPNIFNFYEMDYRFHENTKMVDFDFNVVNLAAETRSSAIASIIQPMNKLTQGPAVTAESVDKSLNSRYGGIKIY